MMLDRSQNWLTESAIPLWFKNGIDWDHGGFFESLSLQGDPMDVPKRAMVQARQIYSFSIAERLNCCKSPDTRRIVEHGVEFLLKRFSLPSGAFMHSVDRKGNAQNTTPDLYTQAFALFGMAHAFGVNPSDELKQRSKALIRYLPAERRAPGGGFTEVKDGKVTFESNPHMHLFEAALSWMDVDQDPEWRALADEILELCLNRFIDPQSGVLCEQFHEGWTAIRDSSGRFMFEPGHQYEWAWLLGRYQKHTGRDLNEVRMRLFDLSEKHGICPARKMAYDEMWSDMTPKTKTSRFWPQCERIKAAVQLGLEAPAGKREAYDRVATDALESLFRFFEVPMRGTWFDRCTESSEFLIQPAKASSLYHIIGAIHEYVRGKSMASGAVGE
jgi:mannose-6-phosphate isomerase